MNLFDFGHSLITGEWRLRREVVRETRAFYEKTRSKRELLLAAHDHRMQLYAGAEPGINRPAPNILSTPEDYKQAFERIVLIRAARQMEEDQGFFDGLLDDFETYVVGEEALYMPNTGNPEADKLIREYCEWKFAEIDYSNRLDLTKIGQLAMRSMKRDGECGFIPIDVGDAWKIRYYSGDCIGNPMIGANVGPNNYNGIRVNGETDSPEWYDLFKRVPKLSAYYPERSVPADQFWHFYDPFRFQQYHGVSAFKTAIRDGFDIDQILEFTKLNIKWRSSQLPSVHTETGRPRGAQNGYWGWGMPGGNGPVVPTNANGVPQPMQTQVDGVVTNYLKLDEQIMEYPNDFPNAQLQVSIEEFRRQCCKGVRIPYEFAFRADNGGVVQRFWVDKAMKTFGKDKHLIRRVLFNPIKNRTIQKGIDTGELNLDSFGSLNEDPRRFRGQWRMGAQTSVDYGRETEADLKQIDAGLMSPVDFTADNGRNLEEIEAEKKARTIKLFKDAEEISKATGQSVESILPYLSKLWPNPPTPVQQKDMGPAAIDTPGSSGNPTDLLAVSPRKARKSKIEA